MPEIWQQADTPRRVGDGRAGVDGGLGRVQRWWVCGTRTSAATRMFPEARRPGTRTNAAVGEGQRRPHAAVNRPHLAGGRIVRE